VREALVLADVKRILRRSDDEGAGSALRQTSDALRGVMGASPTLKLALLRYVHVLAVQTGCRLYRIRMARLWLPKTYGPPRRKAVLATWRLAVCINVSGLWA
jgi:hypothetical protein